MSDPFRLKLHTKLVECLGSSNVYYQPPETLKISYPAIIYNLNSLPTNYADNGTYLIKRRYNVVLVTKEVDPTLMYKMLEIPKTTFNTHYRSDGLNHYSYTITE